MIVLPSRKLPIPQQNNRYIFVFISPYVRTCWICQTKGIITEFFTTRRVSCRYSIPSQCPCIVILLYFSFCCEKINNLNWKGSLKWWIYTFIKHQLHVSTQLMESWENTSISSCTVQKMSNFIGGCALCDTFIKSTGNNVIFRRFWMITCVSESSKNQDIKDTFLDSSIHHFCHHFSQNNVSQFTVLKLSLSFVL